MQMQRLLPGILACCVGLALVGCIVKKNGGQSPANQPHNGGTATDQPAATPGLEPGGIARLPLGIAVDDPALQDLDLSDPRLFALARCIEMPLQRALPSGELASGLASNAVSADGGKTWVFELRAVPGRETEPEYLGRLFILRCKELLRGPESPLRAQLADLLAGGMDYSKGKGDEIAGLRLEGKLLTIELSRPNQVFPAWSSQPGLGVLLNRALPAAGYGPFGLIAVEGNTLVLKPNPDALDGQPLLSELRFICEPDKRRQVELFKQGELDAANVYWEDAAAVASDLKPSMIEHESASMLLCLFDLHEAPWADEQFQSKVGLRKALNQAVDLALLTETFGHQFKPWRHFLAPEFESFIAPERLQQPIYQNVADPPAAAASLKAANHEQGNYLIPGMDLGYRDIELVDTKLVTELLRYWRDISVRMKPFPLTAEQQALRVSRGTHEILLVQNCPAYPDVDAGLYPMLHSALAGTGGNLSLLKDPAVDLALASGQASTGVARQKIYQSLNQLLEDKAYAVFLGNAAPTLLINPKLGGMQLSAYDYDASLPAQDFAQLGFRRQ